MCFQLAVFKEKPSMMLYCIFHYSVFHAKHSHHRWLPSVKINAACNANMTKRQLLILAFWFSSWGVLHFYSRAAETGFPRVSAYIYMPHMQMKISVFIFPFSMCISEREKAYEKIVYPSWPISSKHSVNGRYAESLHLPRCCWHSNVQRLPDLSSQSSLSVLRLLWRSRAKEGSYLKYKNRQTVEFFCHDRNYNRDKVAIPRAKQ